MKSRNKLFWIALTFVVELGLILFVADMAEQPLKAYVYAATEALALIFLVFMLGYGSIVCLDTTLKWIVRRKANK